MANLGITSSTRGVIPQIRLGALVMTGMMMGTLMPFVLSSLAPFVLGELNWTRTQYGSLITVTFLVAMLASPVAGRLVDSSASRYSIFVLFGLSAAALVTVSFATSYGSMVFAAILSGLSMSGANPSTNKLVSAFGRSQFKGLLVGVKQSGVQVGTLLSGSMLPPLAAAVGWRGLVRMTAIVPVGLAVLAAAVMPSRWPSIEYSHDDRGRVTGVGWLMSYVFLIGGGLAAAMAHLPLYAHERLGQSPGTSGLVLGAVGLTGIGSRIAAGHYANRMHDESLLTTWFAGAAVVALILIWGAEAWGVLLVWIGALLLGSSAVAWNAVAMLLILKRLGYGIAGRVSARVSLAFYGGFVLSPIGFGLIVDRSNNYSFGWALATAHLVGALIVAWLFTHRPSDLRPTARGGSH